MKIRVCTISDIHLGHKRIVASFIIANLVKYFLGNAEVAKANMIVIAGDLFDRLLEPTSPVKAEAFHFFVQLCKFCKQHNIVLRILEGTPLHDWKQAEILETIHEIANLEIDYKYVRALSIEYMEQFGINVLYIPDEWRHTGSETLAEVKSLMQSRGLDKVDFGFFHGCFDYQLPPVVDKTPHHSSEEYLNLVTEYIFIGHHHTFSRFERIVAQGSFDRLSHNQEEAKGFVIADVDIGKNNRSLYFIENKGASIHISVDCTNLPLEVSLNKITEAIKYIPEYSNVRIVGEKNHPIFADMKSLLQVCPTIWWTKKEDSGEKNDLIKQFEATDQLYKAVSITKDNILGLVMDRPAFQNLLASQYDRCVRHLKEAL